MGPDAMSLVFWMLGWVLSQLFHSGLSPSLRGSFIALCFLPLGWCHLHNYHTTGLVSHTSKVMRKIFKARLQWYLNQELPNVQTVFPRGRSTRDQIANICWIMEKAREFQKNIYFCMIDYVKAFDYVDYNKLWKILKEMGVPDQSDMDLWLVEN